MCFLPRIKEMEKFSIISPSDYIYIYIYIYNPRRKSKGSEYLIGELSINGYRCIVNYTSTLNVQNKKSFYIKIENSLPWCHYKFISGCETIIRYRLKVNKNLGTKYLIYFYHKLLVILMKYLLHVNSLRVTIT